MTRTSPPGVVSDSTAGATPPSGRSRIWRGLLRWSRRLAVGLLSLAVALTLFCVCYNAATSDRAQPPPGMTYARTGNIDTRYREWGNAQAPGAPVVLVHGFIEDSDIWSQVAPRLAGQHHVQAYDMSGFGYTQRRGPYDLHALSQQLAQFLDARGVQRPVLAGHSVGAAVIAQFALDHPDRVGGILFLDGDGLGGGKRRPPTFLDPWRTTVLRLAVGSDWVINSLYSSQCGPLCPPLDAAGLDQWRRPLQVPGAEEALWEMSKNGLLGLSPAEISRLAATGIPAAVVAGADDPGFSEHTPAPTASRIGAGPATIIPDSRHLTLISHPGQVAAEIESLTSRVHPGN